MTYTVYRVPGSYVSTGQLDSNGHAADVNGLFLFLMCHSFAVCTLVAKSKSFGFCICSFITIYE